MLWTFLSCVNILQNDYTEESEALNFKRSRGQDDLMWQTIPLRWIHCNLKKNQTSFCFNWVLPGLCV